MLPTPKQNTVQEAGKNQGGPESNPNDGINKWKILLSRVLPYCSIATSMLNLVWTSMFAFTFMDSQMGLFFSIAILQLHQLVLIAAFVTTALLLRRTLQAANTLQTISARIRRGSIAPRDSVIDSLKRRVNSCLMAMMLSWLSFVALSIFSSRSARGLYIPIYILFYVEMFLSNIVIQSVKR